MIAYDVSDDRRRFKVANLLSADGNRVQFSVFILDCRPAKLIRIRTQLAELIKADEDSVLICDRGAPGAAVNVTMQYLGTRRAITADSMATVQQSEHEPCGDSQKAGDPSHAVSAGQKHRCGWDTSPRDQSGLRRRAFANHFKIAGQHPYTEDPMETLVSVALHRGGYGGLSEVQCVKSRRS